MPASACEPSERAILWYLTRQFNTTASSIFSPLMVYDELRRISCTIVLPRRARPWISRRYARRNCSLPVLPRKRSQRGRNLYEDFARSSQPSCFAPRDLGELLVLRNWMT